MMIRKAILICVLAFCGTLSCLTPSVPIPPPEPEEMVFSFDAAAGEGTLTFDPNPSFANALVYVFNRDQGTGIIETARADGSVGPTRTFRTDLGDEIVVTFETELQLAGICVEFQEGRSSSALECGSF